MQLRQCGFDDLDAVLQIEAQSFDHPYDRVVFQDHLARHPNGFLLAVADDHVVAYAIFSALDRRGLIVSIAVAPPFRRSGIGGRLLHEALRLLCARTDLVELQVAVDNLGAIMFYRQHGFKMATRIPHYYGVGGDAYLMRRLCAAKGLGKR